MDSTIRRFEDAVADRALNGARSPEDREASEQEYRDALAALEDVVAERDLHAAPTERLRDAVERWRRAELSDFDLNIEANEWYERSEATSLARLKARWQTEAVADAAGAGALDDLASTLDELAADLRRRATRLGLPPNFDREEEGRS